MPERADQLKQALATACHATYGDNLVTVGIYGSWARGTATPLSDIDVLLIATDLPPGRGRRVRQFAPVDEATSTQRVALWGAGTPIPELTPLIKTPAEVGAGSPLFLDMTDWCETLYDRGGFFAAYLDGLRQRLRALGSRRRWSHGGYYWEYKPDLRPGEVVEL
ncbi:nucleotidyltransferase domain-containing protein [bacterium]|nr:nucleotidyltransferase domain-containing protein [bacterium]